jgi:hypothetical protein
MRVERSFLGLPPLTGARNLADRGVEICNYLDRSRPAYRRTHPRYTRNPPIVPSIFWYLGVQTIANSKFQHTEMHGDGLLGDTNLANGQGKSPVPNLLDGHLQTPLK